MSDYNSSLPVRTENAGDVIAKIADATVPSQQLKVEADGSINVNTTISATNLDIRDLVFATDKVDVSGSVVALDAPTLAALENITVSATDLDIRDLTFAADKVDASGSVVALDAPTLAALENITVSATNLDIRDLAFATDKVDVSGSSVSIVAPGSSVADYSTAAAVAGGGTSNHDYTSTGNFFLSQVHASGSGKMKIEILVNAVSKFVFFNSTANPNMTINIENPILATTGQVVRVIRTNREGSSQDVYSTIIGYTV